MEQPPQTENILVDTISKDDLVQRHKKENKDLQATITGLKKQATKKTRKNVLNKCQELQYNLDLKHKQELSQFEQGNEEEEEEITPEQLLQQLNLKEESTPLNHHQSDDNNNNNTIGIKKKRNRQKERLAKRDLEIQQIKQQAQLEASNSIDYRQIEIDSMNKLLQMNKLKLYEIKPDGHCLFASIQDQLKTLYSIEKSINELRQLSANYILENKQDFIPFLFDENTMEIKDVDEYCNELVNTAMWGSDMEILALSKTFKCQIHIYIAGASTIKINEDSSSLNQDDEDEIIMNEPLKLGYYKHSYGLGEHYNSLRLIE